MPNRILKESICSSDSIDKLGWFEEVLFYRLIVNCDDYGRFDGRPAIIRSRLFPLKENITLKSIETAINRLATVGVVMPYNRDGKPYLQLPGWHEHQQIRASKSKFPAPEEGMTASDIICNQMIADVPVIVIENPNPNPNPNREAESKTREAPPRHKRGKYANVLLSDAELEELKADFPSDWEARIDRLSEYIASTGKSYKSHLATIRAWARRDGVIPGQQAGGKKIDIDKLKQDLETV